MREALWGVLIAVNLLCILALICSVIWAGFALGNHEEFMYRFTVVLALQVPCIAFIFLRRLVRP